MNPEKLQLDKRQTGPYTCGPETLLLIEGDPVLRGLACSVLRAEGFTVLLAVSGQEGIRVARQHKDAPIRLAIMDFIMPQINGKVVAEWLKLTYPNIRILFTSGYAEVVRFQDDVLTAGAEFLPKPYATVSLCEKVRAMLDA